MEHQKLYIRLRLINPLQYSFSSPCAKFAIICDDAMRDVVSHHEATNKFKCCSTIGFSDWFGLDSLTEFINSDQEVLKTTRR
jgi:hypothetical protein